MSRFACATPYQQAWNIDIPFLQLNGECILWQQIASEDVHEEKSTIMGTAKQGESTVAARFERCLKPESPSEEEKVDYTIEFIRFCMSFVLQLVPTLVTFGQSGPLQVYR